MVHPLYNHTVYRCTTFAVKKNIEGHLTSCGQLTNTLSFPYVDDEFPEEERTRKKTKTATKHNTSAYFNKRPTFVVNSAEKLLGSQNVRKKTT